MTRPDFTRTGFTVMEILVVTAIIGILAATLLPSLWESTTHGKIGKAQTEVKQISQAVNRLEFDTGAFADGCTTDNGSINIDDLSSAHAGVIQNPSGESDEECDWSDADLSNWNGPYMETMPEDPWGNNYVFTTDYTGGSCDVPHGVAVFSYGPDATPADGQGCNNIVRYIENDAVGAKSNFEHHPDN